MLEKSRGEWTNDRFFLERLIESDPSIVSMGPWYSWICARHQTMKRE